MVGMGVKVTAGLALLACWVSDNARAANTSSAFAELARLVGDRVFSDLGDFRDCSNTSISYLDAHVLSEESNWIASWPFTWAKVAIDGGTCIYLEKPERRGLTSEESRVFMSAASQHIEFPVELPPTCPKADIRDVDSKGIEDGGQGHGYSYSISYADMTAALAPLDRIQHGFAAEQKKQLKVRAKGVSNNAMGNMRLE